MRLLLIHQNFPGQFSHLARVLAERGHEIVALGHHTDRILPPGITYGAYSLAQQPEAAASIIDPLLELALQRAERVATACRQLAGSGWRPEAVIFHSAWGEGLYLRDVWPETVLVAYPELYGTPEALGHGYDTDLAPIAPAQAAALRRQNLTALAAIADSDAVICPTRHQRDSFPAHLRRRFRVIHEGVDCRLLRPRGDLALQLSSTLTIRPGDPLITYCSRHLEPLRGFPTFLRALPELQRKHPRLQVAIVGETSHGYGPPSPHPGSYAGALIEELGEQLDLSRLHRLGTIPHAHLVGLFQLSRAHVYLTYPYALSWSLLEAMACGAPVVGSRCAPVQEVIRDERNGLLVDFNDPQQLCNALDRLLLDPGLGRRLGRAGRRCVQRRFSLERGVRAYETLLNDLIAAASARSASAPDPPVPASRAERAAAAG
ncbi:MAG: glycosyltransferase [Synechococcaceae cyanobacterium]|nr:glycosyltransferase [Synechococcaceae cyanobacterium]